MRIVHTVEFYHPRTGGAQEVVRQLSQLMAARGHEVTVATTACPERKDKIINGVRIQEFQCAGNAVRGMSGEIARYQKFIIDGGFDVLMSYAAQQWATDALYPVLDQMPFRKVLAPCGFSGLYDPAYEQYFADLPGTLTKYDRLIFHSDCYRDIEFCRQLHTPNIEVIPNGAAAGEFDVIDTTFRSRLAIPENQLLLLTVGSHTHWKGHTEAIAAFGAAKIGPATLVVIGNTNSSLGCLPKDVAQSKWMRLKSLGRKRVLLLDPPRADVVAAYHAADLFVFPSNIECSPLVLFEAMASRTPFIANDVGNSREIAAWSGSGVILPTHQKPGAPPGYCQCRLADLARRIEELAADPARRSAMAESGYQAWKKRFNWEYLSTRYEAAYRGEAPAP